MSRTITISVTAYFLALIGTVILDAPAIAQDNITIIYEPPNKVEFQPIYQKLKDRAVLETLQRFLSPIKTMLTVKTDECHGNYYAPYQAGGPVIICYEYVSLIESVMPGEETLKSPQHYPGLLNYLGRIGPILVTREMATAGPFVQQVLHETGLAVFDKLGVPIWGRREDAADYIAAFLMLQFGTDVARKTVFGTAYFLNQWDLLYRDRFITDENYLGDIRPTVRQRYYNILCIAIGYDPIGFSSFIAIDRDQTDIDLPASRIVHCRGGLAGGRAYGTDYDKVSRGFSEYIRPSLDQKLLKEVQGTKWLPDE
jgi:hypothetical protein